MSREITPTQIAKAISDLLEENEKQKERIDKAIEYIEEHKIEYKDKDEVIATEFDYLTSPYYLLSILGGKE